VGTESLAKARTHLIAGELVEAEELITTGFEAVS